MQACRIAQQCMYCGYVTLLNHLAGAQVPFGAPSKYCCLIPRLDFVQQFFVHFPLLCHM